MQRNFKGTKGGSIGSANFVKGTGWGRVLDLVDEALDEHGGFVC